MSNINDYPAVEPLSHHQALKFMETNMSYRHSYAVSHSPHLFNICQPHEWKDCSRDNHTPTRLCFVSPRGPIYYGTHQASPKLIIAMETYIEHKKD